MSPKMHTPKISEFVHGHSVESGRIHGIHGIQQEKVGDCKVLGGHTSTGDEAQYHRSMDSRVRGMGGSGGEGFHVSIPEVYRCPRGTCGGKDV